MKSHFLIPAILLTPFVVMAQFGAVMFIDTLEGRAVRQLKVADLDEDQRQDILVANLQWPNDHLTYYAQQHDGSFQLVGIPAADSMPHFEHFTVGDVLPGGAPEILAAYGFPWQISMFMRQDEVFEQVVVDDSLDFTTELLTCDFNDDGITDLLSLQHTEIVLYLAIAPGQFDEGRIIHSGTEFYAIDTGHYNQDTLLDISVASDGFDILFNDGSGHFDLQESTHIGLTFRLQSADLDRDGDTDIAAYESLRGILFYANDGLGHFTKEDTILESTDIYDAFLLDDMDCDGDIDAYTAIPQPGWVTWIENDGTGHFPLLHQIHFQSGELIRAVALGDFDKDHTPDPVWGYFTLATSLNECMATAITETDKVMDGWTLSPNPSSGQFFIQNTSTSRISVTIVDFQGRIVVPVFSLEASYTTQIDLELPGMYLVQVSDKNGFRSAKKILIVR
jgi:hypothetical protein